MNTIPEIRMKEEKYHMKRYVALLRGINISGKNKIPMSELKERIAGLDLSEAATYLNSGNVIFSSAVDDKDILSNKLTSMIKDEFALDIPVFIILQEELRDTLKNAPAWWGDDNKEIYDNLIFLIPPLSYEEFYSVIGSPKADYEKVYNYNNAVFWSFSRKEYQKTNWWRGTASSKVSDKITIRTANTVRKIVDM